MVEVLLTDLFKVVTATVAIGYLCWRTKIPAQVGMLLGGILVGPSVLHFVQDEQQIEQLAEIASVFLLFTIGLGFELEPLKKRWLHLTSVGLLQIGIALGITVVVSLLLGFTWQQSVFLGMLVSLSSSAYALARLNDLGELKTLHGNVTTGILIVQDLAIVPFAILLPFLNGAGGDGMAVALSLGEALVFLVVASAGIWYVAPFLLDEMNRTRSSALFIRTVVAVCLGTALAASLAGLSISLGAFLAGMMLSQSRYRTQLRADLYPFQAVAASFFFLVIGMLLDIAVVTENFGTILLVLLGVGVVKYFAGFMATLPASSNVGPALKVGAHTSHIGEFSFVLLATAAGALLLPERIHQIVIAVAVLTLLANPVLTWISSKMDTRFGEFSFMRKVKEELGFGAESGLNKHLIVIGGGTTGHGVREQALNEGRSGVIVDRYRPNIRQFEGHPEFGSMVGDATNSIVLSDAGIHRASDVVVGVPELHTSLTIVRKIREMTSETNPDLRVFVRIQRVEHEEIVRNAGADDVSISEELAAQDINRRLFTPTLPVE